MVKTLLYRNISENKIQTFAEIKSEYEFMHECEIEVDNATINSYIYNNSCIGGNIDIIDNNDEVLKWLNDYANCVEAERGMADEEIDESIRDLYVTIKNKNDDWTIQATKDNIEGDVELLERLENLLK